MKGRTDPKTAARAIQLACPNCKSKPGIRCSVPTWPRGISHCRLHIQRLDMARALVAAEERATRQQAYGRIGDAV